MVGVERCEDGEDSEDSKDGVHGAHGERETDDAAVTGPRTETFGNAMASVAFLHTLAVTSVACAYVVGTIVIP